MQAAEILDLSTRQLRRIVIIDRLTHKPYMINMNEPSFRMKETKEWLKKQSYAWSSFQLKGGKKKHYFFKVSGVLFD